ncbi:hypothetical protein [Burkholderia anthina]|uniref:hypothetical protein n=1 Tax=Burkholderia anthina TaxID=179879 RepID=UPI0015898A7E|nr:hypothetical protein [Burkholderia anthina]
MTQEYIVIGVATKVALEDGKPRESSSAEYLTARSTLLESAKRLSNDWRGSGFVDALRDFIEEADKLDAVASPQESVSAGDRLQKDAVAALESSISGK